MDEIVADLAAEHDALDAVVRSISEGDWRTPTAADGWTVHDTIFHLAFFDDASVRAITTPEQYIATRIQMPDFEAMAAALSGAALYEWWSAQRAALLEALGGIEASARIPWYGPDMGARSFATARLMETWSHGRDVADALGAVIPATDRLRHVCHIGVSTRGWSYLVRGLQPPDGPVRVELTAPSGAQWVWGPDDAPDSVSGSAEQFCLVVTQRRSIADVDLSVVGPLAAEWMSIAQAFAGAATLTPAGRSV